MYKIYSTVIKNKGIQTKENSCKHGLFLFT